MREDPHLPRGKGSAPFDDEGVATRPRDIVDAGVVESYFLSTYSARKLGMRDDRPRRRLAQPDADVAAAPRPATTSRRCSQKLGRGLFVIELMGQGINYVTGDYSRGAAGFWVENGKIAFPVHEVTIAGNLREMFASIVAVGADAYTMGSKTIGSVLIEQDEDRRRLSGSARACACPRASG